MMKYLTNRALNNLGYVIRKDVTDMIHMYSELRQDLLKGNSLNADKLNDIREKSDDLIKRINIYQEKSNERANIEPMEK